MDRNKGPCYQNAKQARVGRKRQVNAYEFGSEISRVKGRDASSFEKARREKQRGGRQRRKKKKVCLGSLCAKLSVLNFLVLMPPSFFLEN